jgi:hypothetical protein
MIETNPLEIQSFCHWNIFDFCHCFVFRVFDRKTGVFGQVLVSGKWLSGKIILEISKSYNHPDNKRPIFMQMQNIAIKITT